MDINELYSFVFKGILTDESLDKAGRQKNTQSMEAEYQELAPSLGLDWLEEDLLADARKMAVVYTAIHAFENMVRELVVQTMAEHYGETWWDNVSSNIKNKVQSRMEVEAEFSWHGNRGSSEIIYCDFSHLKSIIVKDWDIFENILHRMDWAKSILDTLETSRNIVMHGGVLEQRDIERIGMNIRDWIRQVG